VAWLVLISCGPKVKKCWFRRYALKKKLLSTCSNGEWFSSFPRVIRALVKDWQTKQSAEKWMQSDTSKNKRTTVIPLRIAHQNYSASSIFKVIATYLSYWHFFSLGPHQPYRWWILNTTFQSPDCFRAGTYNF